MLEVRLWRQTWSHIREHGFMGFTRGPTVSFAWFGPVWFDWWH